MPETRMLQRKLPSRGAVVPALWHFEVSNIFATGIRRKRIAEDEARMSLKKLNSLPIAIEKRAEPVTGSDLLPLILRYSLTAYDAAYLELAKRNGFALATLDKQLVFAAQQEGISLLIGIP